MTVAKTNSVAKIPKLEKLEDEPMWIEACQLAEHIYGLLHLLPDDEKWNTTTKLQNSANDLMFFVSQALGNPNVASVEYDWANSRKAASGLKTMYRFAGKQKFIDLDPEIMVRLNNIIGQVDKRIIKSNELNHQSNIEEISHWRKKYENSKEDGS